MDEGGGLLKANLSITIEICLLEVNIKCLLVELDLSLTSLLELFIFVFKASVYRNPEPVFSVVLELDLISQGIGLLLELVLHVLLEVLGIDVLRRVSQKRVLKKVVDRQST